MSKLQFYPMAVVIRTDDMSHVEKTATEIEELLKETYGDEYGIAIYDPGDDMPIVAFFNEEDATEALEGE